MAALAVVVAAAAACAQPPVGCERSISAANPAGCWRPYGSTSPFNRPLPKAPRVLPGSAALVADLLEQGPVPPLGDRGTDWSHALYFPAPDDPVHTVHCTAAWGRCEIEGDRVRLPRGALPAGGGDGHLAVLDRSTGWEHDLWQVQQPGPGRGRLLVSWGGRTRLDGDGLGSDATAAHFGLAAGVVRAGELAAGRVEHALFVVVGCVSGEVVWPAAASAAECDDGRRGPPTGQHLWLDMTEDEIERLDVPAWGKIVLRAFSHYGGFVGDTGGNESLSLQLESPAPWTSRGLADPLPRVPLDLAAVPWAERLRALDPCVALRRC